LRSEAQTHRSTSHNGTCAAAGPRYVVPATEISSKYGRRVRAKNVGDTVATTSSIVVTIDEVTMSSTVISGANRTSLVSSSDSSALKVRELLNCGNTVEKASWSRFSWGSSV
jgi:hypothetical protein